MDAHASQDELTSEVDATQPEGPSPVRLTTFDCFDTVVTRTTGSARSVAYVVAHRLRRQGVLPFDTEVIVAARARAEALLWERVKDDHVLADISAEMVEILGVDPSLVPVITATELDVERSSMRAVPWARALVEQARDSGATVAFLSDTPLSGEFVEDLLSDAGVMEPGESVWVSNELGAGKNTGGAFAAVSRRLGGRPAAWTHTGDDPRADVRMARLAGIAASHRTEARLNRYEKALEEAAPANAGLSALMAGASRQTRLRLAEERPDMPRARAEVVAGVAGPVLTGYVLWCLRRAQDAGLRRLYFVARDGEVLLELARRLAPSLDIDIELRYLEGSRRAWLLPAMADVDRGHIAAVMGREEKVTVRGCLGWVGVTPEEVGTVLEEAGFAEGTWDDPIDAAAEARLVDVIVGPGVVDLVSAHAAEHAGATRRYLESVGLMDGEPFGLVDIGWQGTVGRLLTAVLESFGGGPPALECYYGLTRPTHDAPGRRLLGYMFDDWRGLGTGPTTDLWVALEVFTAALHGRVEGYVTDDTEVRPRYGPPNEAALKWGFADVRDGLRMYGDELAATLPAVDPWLDVRGATHGNLRTFWEHPSDAEVQAWRDYPLEADAEMYPIAASFSAAEVVASVRQGRPRMRRRGTWPAGSMVVAPGYIRLLRRGMHGARVGLVKARRAHYFWRVRREPGSMTSEADRRPGAVQRAEVSTKEHS